MPHLRTYWNQLQQVLDDNSQSNALLQEEAYQVYGALLVCYTCGLFIARNWLGLQREKFILRNLFLALLKKFSLKRQVWNSTKRSMLTTCFTEIRGD